jgi:uncharacterized membrane protein
MAHYLMAYVATAVVFLAIDFVWLAFVAKRFYADRLGDLLLDRPNMPAAAVFYLVYVVGIVIFAVTPALRAGTGMTALGCGALFGFFAYATYDMTNYATLKNWPLEVSVVDVLWGTFVTGAAAMAGYWGTRFVAGE